MQNLTMLSKCCLMIILVLSLIDHLHFKNMYVIMDFTKLRRGFSLLWELQILIPHITLTTIFKVLARLHQNTVVIFNTILIKTTKPLHQEHELISV